MWCQSVRLVCCQLSRFRSDTTEDLACATGSISEAFALRSQIARNRLVKKKSGWQFPEVQIRKWLFALCNAGSLFRRSCALGVLTGYLHFTPSRVLSLLLHVSVETPVYIALSGAEKGTTTKSKMPSSYHLRQLAACTGICLWIGMCFTP